VEEFFGIKYFNFNYYIGCVSGASRARALSTFMDIASIPCPTANSTFVVDKKVMRNVEEPVSPEMFSPDIGTHIKETNANKTYDLTKRLSARNPTKKLGIIVDLPEESPISTEHSNSKQPETLVKINLKNKKYKFFFLIFKITNNYFS